MGGEATPLPKTPASEAVAATIEKAGFGLYQLLALLLTGGIMFAEGSEMLVMGSITALLRDHWDLNPAVRGLMVSIVFVGFSVGNLLSGQIGDRWGRRPGVLIAYGMIGVFGFMTASARGPFTMLALRFFVGVGCGIGFPAVYSLVPEVCPAKWRGGITTLMIGFMPLGELFAALWVLGIDPNLSGSTDACELGYFPSRSLVNPRECTWKSLCELSALPAFAFLLVSVQYLFESPLYLAAQGRYEDLEQTLARICWMNGVEFNAEEFRAKVADGEVAVEASPETPKTIKAEYSFITAVGNLAGPSLWYVTLFMCGAHFTKDFSVFGLSYVLPQYFVFLKTLSAGLQLIIVAALALPGVLLAFLATRVEGVSRVTWMSISAGLCGFFALGMLDAGPDLLAGPCAYLVKLLALSYFIFTVVYTAEAFPTNIRNTAVGCCTSAGRLGSISAPLIFEVSKSVSGTFDFFTSCLITSMALIAASAPFVLPKRGLIDAETSPLTAEDGLSKAKSYGAALET